MKRQRRCSSPDTHESERTCTPTPFRMSNRWAGQTRGRQGCRALQSNRRRHHSQPRYIMQCMGSRKGPTTTTTTTTNGQTPLDPQFMIPDDALAPMYVSTETSRRRSADRPADRLTDIRAPSGCGPPHSHAIQHIHTTFTRPKRYCSATRPCAYMLCSIKGLRRW